MSRWVWGIAFFALALRLLGIESESLWYDETFTAALAGLPLDRIGPATAGDVHPPLWYILEWAIINIFGDSALALRLPSALFGSASAMVAFQIVNKLANEKQAYIASGLMAVMPAQLYYGQEARMYSLLVLLILGGFHAVIEGRYRRLGILSGLALYTHNMSMPYLAVIGVWALFKGQRRALKPLLWAGGAWLPWLGIVIRQATQVAEGFWLAPPANLGSLLYPLYYSTIFTRIPTGFSLASVAAWAGLTAATLYVLRADKKAWPLIALALAPPIMMYGVSVVWKPVLLARAVLPSGAALVALWGMGLGRLRLPTLAPALAVLIPLLSIGLWSHYFNVDAQRFDTEPVRRAILDHWQPGDTIYHFNMSSFIWTSYLLPPDDYRAYVLPSAGDLEQHITAQSKRDMGIIESEFTELIGHYDRVWIIYAETPMNNSHIIETARDLPARYPVIDYYEFPQTELSRLRLFLVDIRDV